MCDEAPTAAERIARVFARPDGRVSLGAGETLVREGEPLTRLYRIAEGAVAGHVSAVGETGETEETFVMRGGPGDLVGVQSFFSGRGRSAMRVRATAPAVLDYIERGGRWNGRAPLEVALMPAVIEELARRQHQVIAMARRERAAEARMRQMERVSALGQLAAGVAHELNNAVAVIGSGARWLARSVEAMVAREAGSGKEGSGAAGAGRRDVEAFRRGLEAGRALSSGQVRERASALGKRYGLPPGEAKALARTGLETEVLDAWRPQAGAVGPWVRAWELGATLRDLEEASDQARHVVASMRDLGGGPSRPPEPVDVNETVHVALGILRHVRRGIELTFEPGTLVPVSGRRGELVQVWANLVKNACEALHGDPGAEAPAVTIRTRMAEDQVVVEIADNGPGVPPEIAEQIFEPSFTTRKSGLCFGLGLGLSIAENLVCGLGGSIELVPRERGALFRITLPAGASS